MHTEEKTMKQKDVKVKEKVFLFIYMSHRSHKCSLILLDFFMSMVLFIK